MRITWPRIWYTCCTFSVLFVVVVLWPCLRYWLHIRLPLISHFSVVGIEVMIGRLWPLGPCKMWVLRLCPLYVNDVISKEEEDDTILNQDIASLSRQLCPRGSSAQDLINTPYIFGTDLPDSRVMCNRAYGELGINWASISSVRRIGGVIVN